MSRWSLASCVLLVAARLGFAQSGAPLHYYDSAIGKTGAPLKAALQAIIRNHTVIPYTSTLTDTWDALKVLDEDPSNASKVVLIYSGLTAFKVDQQTGTSGTWNREHLWPQSYGITALNGNSRAVSDLFNLRPIDIGANSSRGNKYYDISVAPIGTYVGAPGSTYDVDSWEPRTADKGPIARAMFYMAVRYDGSDADVPDLELSDLPNANAARFGKLTTLLAWNRQFAVEASDRQRNQTIYSVYQHNRNPFIDHADYADMVFNNATPAQAWKNIHFMPAELSDPTISGDDADPDGDGLGNLLEYFFSRDPWQAEAAPALTVSVSAIAGSYSLLLSYPHNRNATDVVLSYETSTNLTTWAPTSAQLTSDIVTSSETEQITVRFPSSASGYLARVRAARTTP